jgi:hypothetical protein
LLLQNKLGVVVAHNTSVLLSSDQRQRPTQRPGVRCGRCRCGPVHAHPIFPCGPTRAYHPPCSKQQLAASSNPPSTRPTTHHVPMARHVLLGPRSSRGVPATRCSVSVGVFLISWLLGSRLVYRFTTSRTIYRVYQGRSFLPAPGQMAFFLPGICFLPGPVDLPGVGKPVGCGLARLCGWAWGGGGRGREAWLC